MDSSNIKNFKYLNDLIQNSSGKVILDFDIVLDEGEELEFPEGIKISYCDIDGNGHTIDGKHKTRIFTVSGYSTVKNITFKNGNSKGWGGAIYCIDSTKIMNCKFIKNHSNDGGAIYSQALLEIQGSDFLNNTAERGGAILNRMEANIRESNFNFNEATESGAIHNEQNCKLTIENTNFNYNIAYFAGGAIMTFSQLDVESSYFSNNIATTGGVIYEAFGEINIVRSKFENNNSIDEGKSILRKRGDLNSFINEFSSDEEEEIHHANHESLDSVRVEYCKFNVAQQSLESNQSDFKYLDELIHSGQKEIALDRDIVLVPDEIGQYREGICIDVDDLVIDGNGHSIDGLKRARIFHVNAKNVEIKNITLKNALYRSGSAIINAPQSVLEISSIDFINNTSLGNASALLNFGKIEIENSTFKNNTTRSGDTSAILNQGNLRLETSIIANNQGTAITNRDGIMDIKDCTISKNTSRSAAAIFNIISFEESKNKLSISNTTFEGNVAELEGGAIINIGSLEVEGSTFKNNCAEEIGGILTNKRGNIQVTNCKFCSNTTRYGNAIINSEEGLVKIRDCKIYENTNFNTIISNNYDLQVFNTIFKGNLSKHMFQNIDEDTSTLGIFNSKVIDNTLESEAIANDGKKCTLSRTTFENNVLKNGIIIDNQKSMVIDKINLKDEKISNNGHILLKNLPHEFKNMIEGEGDVEIDDSSDKQYNEFDFNYLDDLIHKKKLKNIILTHDITLEYYELDFYDGGIELDVDNLEIDGRNHIIDAKKLSRIFYITGKNITLKNIRFENGQLIRNFENPRNSNGGAIRIHPHGDLTLIGCSFKDNTSPEGGAIYSEGCVESINSTFMMNNSDSGGAIHNYQGKVTLKDNEIKLNFCKHNGGAIYSNGGAVEIINPYLSNNISDYNGGAVYCSKTTLKITDGIILENRAKNGGAINAFKSTVTLKGFSTYKNQASGDGGFISSSHSKLDITDVSFSNQGEYGGSIYCNDSATKIEGGYFEKNFTIDNELIRTEQNFGVEIRNSGGAIYNLGGEMIINNARFTENKSKGGGAIYNDGKMKMKGCDLISNSVEKEEFHKYSPGNAFFYAFMKNKNLLSSILYGGAIINYGELCVLKCNFKDNNVGDWVQGFVTGIKQLQKGCGGAIHNRFGKLKVIESKFNDNTAKVGRAVSSEKAENFEIIDCEFDDEDTDIYESDTEIEKETLL